MRPFNPHSLYDTPHLRTHVPHNHNADTSLSATQNSTSPYLPPLVPNRRRASNEHVNVITPFPSSQGSSSSGRDRKRLLELSNASSSPLPDDSRSAPSSASPRNGIPPSLTDEQADFINDLYNNNVPAAAVARVIERMLADRQAGIREWQHELRFSRTDSIATTAPPSYDVIHRS